MSSNDRPNEYLDRYQDKCVQSETNLADHWRLQINGHLYSKEDLNGNGVLQSTKSANVSRVVLPIWVKRLRYRTITDWCNVFILFNMDMLCAAIIPLIDMSETFSGRTNNKYQKLRPRDKGSFSRTNNLSLGCGWANPFYRNTRKDQMQGFLRRP